MKTNLLKLFVLLFSTAVFSQAGHIMQGVGAVNMSMGGAATGQPLDISGALQWNPAAISTFDSNILKFDIGAFFSSPELSSSLPAGMLGSGAPGVSGITEDDRPASPMPALAYVWSKEDSKHTFGVSAFGISGFGVTFPEEDNNPLSSGFNPTVNSNPINYPQQAMGFGRVESDYLLLQVGLAYAYEISDKFSIGFQPNINYAALELMPNPLSSPSPTLGYPVSDKASAIGFGGQVGIFYDSGDILKLGASYKTPQFFSEFDFSNTYLDGSEAPNVKFKMNYPAIFSVGMGLSGKKIDFALDFRYVDYENTDGFEASGWTPTASVAGFGWESITIVSAGLQYKITDKFPVRVGYTYSSNPIQNELAFFSIPATAIIKDAAQLGLGYKFSDRIEVNAVYHQGFRGKGSSGQLLSPLAISPNNPTGALPGTNVSYKMETSMIMVGLSYTFNKKEVMTN